MLPKVSLIMPSLNVAPYYDKCMESAIGQSLKDMEIIAVDAGSTDGTLDIIKKYAESDPRITVIHSDKKSYGAQMNLGLEAANGEYIAFLETDDYLCPYALERLYSIAAEDKLDYVKGWTYSFWEREGIYSRVLDDDKICQYLPQGEDIFSPRENPWLLISDFHIWNGIYRRSFLQRIRFNETKGAAFQDIGFIVQYLTKANAARYVDLPVYWYRRSNASSSVYNQAGLRYLADEYEKIVQIGTEITEAQWPFIWKRLIVQILTRFENMYKSGQNWLSVESDLQRLEVLLKMAEKNNQLSEISSDDIYGHLLHLILQKRYERLKTPKWIADPARYILDIFVRDKLLIYGAGKRGRMVMAAALKLNKWPPIAFVDTNPQLWGKIINGVRVISLEESRKKYPDSKYLIAVKGHEREIEDKLLSVGVASGNIVCFDVDVLGYMVNMFEAGITVK